MNGRDNASGGQEQGDNEQDDAIQDPGGCGAVIPAEDKEESESELKAQWKAAVATVMQSSHDKMPGDMERMIQDVIDPAIDWTVLLRDFVEKTARNDYAWDIPDQTYLQRGIYVPGLISEELPEVIIAIDTSGSVSQRMLDHFAAEATALLTAYNTTVRIIYCDSRVKKVEVFTSQDMPIKLKPEGGGGTSFIPVFEYINKKGHTPACLIYFTDLYGNFPSKEPEYPTLWLSTTPEKIAPFGDTILYKTT